MNYLLYILDKYNDKEICLYHLNEVLSLTGSYPENHLWIQIDLKKVKNWSQDLIWIGIENTHYLEGQDYQHHLNYTWLRWRAE